VDGEGRRRPDVALIVVSNFLSNAAKNHLESFKRNNKPSFKLKVWERPDLERFTLGKALLLRKYDLCGDFEFLDILHPAHVEYLRHPPINTFDYFFEVLDRLDPAERRSFFTGSFMLIINPEFETATDSKRQTFGELAKGKITYTEFRKRCYEEAQYLSQHFLIQAIMFHELTGAFGCADRTDVQRVRKNMKRSLSFFEAKLKRPHPDPETIQGCIDQMKESLENIEERTAANYERYCAFCEKVVAPLLEEQLPVPPDVRKLAAEEEAYARKHGGAQASPGDPAV